MRKWIYAIICIGVVLCNPLNARKRTNLQLVQKTGAAVKWDTDVLVESGENGRILSMAYEPGTSNLYAMIISDTALSETWVYQTSDGITWTPLFAITHNDLNCAAVQVSQQVVNVIYAPSVDLYSYRYDLSSSTFLGVATISVGDTVEKIDIDTDGDEYYPADDYLYVVAQVRKGIQKYVKFWRSEDGGATWLAETIIDSGDIRGVSISYAYGEDILHIAYVKGDSIMYTKSSDYGDTWDTVNVISYVGSYQPTGDITIASYGTKVFVIFDAYNPTYSHYYQRRIYSDDGGITWSSAGLYYECRKPDATMRGDGVLRLVYYDYYGHLTFQDVVGINIVAGSDTIPYAWSYPVTVNDYTCNTSVYPQMVFYPGASLSAGILYTSTGDSTYFDVGEVDTVFTNVAAVEVLTPTRMTAGDSLKVRFVVTNNGEEDISYYEVYAQLYDESEGSYVAYLIKSFGPISQNDTDTVIMSFPPQEDLSPHKLRVYALIRYGEWDEWRNDDVAGPEYLVAVRDTIFVPFASVIPTLDGEISTGEWDDAEVIDISNTLGMYYVYPDTSLNDASHEVDTATVFAFVKNDSVWLYIAIVGPDSLSRNEAVIEVDDNNDNAWESDTSEGVWAFYPTSWEFFGRFDKGLFSYGAFGPAQYATDTSGGVRVYEIALPLDTPEPDTGYIDALPGDTIGVGIIVDNYSSYIGGWYPQDFQCYSADLSLYAKLILGVLPSVSEDKEVQSEILKAPVFSRNCGYIQLSLPEEAKVKVEVFNITGQKISTLVNRRLEPGTYTFNFSPSSTGLYIVKARVGNKDFVRKMVVVK